VGQDHGLGLARRATGGDHERIADGDWLLRAGGGEDPFAGGRRKPRIERQHGVAGVPGAAQAVDELDGPARLDDDQPPHGGGGYGHGRRSTVGGIDAHDPTRDASIRAEALTKVYEPAAAPADAGDGPPPAVDALDTGDTIPHMNGLVVYAACIAFTAVLLWVGIQGFRRRVLT
jgi:hypothetical protein